MLSFACSFPLGFLPGVQLFKLPLEVEFKDLGLFLLVSLSFLSGQGEAVKKSKLVSACWPSSPAILPLLHSSLPGLSGISAASAAVLEPVEGCWLQVHWARLSEHFQLHKHGDSVRWWGWEGWGRCRALPPV